ncbi:MAG: hypothetical protein ACK56I_20865, partial [bacterium]
FGELLLCALKLRGQGGQLIAQRHAFRIKLLHGFAQVGLLVPDLPDLRRGGTAGARDLLQAVGMALGGRRSAAQRAVLITSERE